MPLCDKNLQARQPKCILCTDRQNLDLIGQYQTRFFGILGKFLNISYNLFENECHLNEMMFSMFTACLKGGCGARTSSFYVILR